jgi:hypothetical protein
MKTKITILIFAITLILITNVKAQLVKTNLIVDELSNSNAAVDFKDRIVMSGIEIINVERGWADKAGGSYSNFILPSSYTGTTKFPLNGAVLSTGNVNEVPNTAKFQSSTDNENSKYGSTLNRATYKNLLAGTLGVSSSDLYNAQYITIDFVPTCDELNISFIFASEEYPEWVGSHFNDGFGIYLGTPIAGISPLTFSYSSNLGTVPGILPPVNVEVNTIDDNHLYPPFFLPGGYPQNPNYYVENSLNNDLVYDGMTVPLTTKISVIPNHYYQIVIIIADNNDPWWDSGLILGRGIGCINKVCAVNTIPTTVGTCNSTANTYSITGTLSGYIENTPCPISSKTDIHIEYDGNDLSSADYNISGPTCTTATGITNFTTSVSANNLPADGKIHWISYRLASPSSCRRSFMYFAPKPCQICTLTNITISAPLCNPLDNTYTLSGVVSYTQPPKDGKLVVTNGNDYVTLLADPSGSTNFSIGPLKSNGANYQLKAYFTSDPTCYKTLPYLAPTPCFVPVLTTNCAGSFKPSAGKIYVLSGWVKESIYPSNFTYLNANLSLKFTIPGTPPTTVSLGPYLASGKIIDGWQRIEQKFTVPASATDIDINLNNLSTTNAAYFDDIRIFPTDGNMKSYVYDPTSLKLVAELDENNYATFYEYDQEGHLIRQKKETERGIVTIKESKSHLPEKP